MTGRANSRPLFIPEIPLFRIFSSPIIFMNSRSCVIDDTIWGGISVINLGEFLKFKHATLNSSDSIT